MKSEARKIVDRMKADEQITNEPIRVLHAVVRMTAGGGAESFLMSVYRNMNRNKVQFDFLTSIEGSYEEEIETLGGRIYRIPHILKGGPVRYRHSLAKFFRDHQEYKIIHSHMDKMSGIVLDEARKAGVPVRISHSHNTDSEGGWLERNVKQYYGRLLRSVPTDRMACSAAAGEWLFPDAFDRVRILKNGIVFDDYRFSELIRESKRSELGLDRDDPVLLHVGRFDEQKNQKFAIDVFERLFREDRKHFFILAGTGPLFDEVKAYADEKGIADKIQFLGLRSDVPALMMAADALVFPSLFEGLSLVLIEAQASGLPCVMTDTLAEESIARPELVTRLPLGDVGIWTDSVRKIIEDHPVATRTSAIPPEYDAKNIASELERFYIRRYSEISAEAGGNA